MKDKRIIRHYKQTMITKLNTVEQTQNIKKKWENLKTNIKTTAEETIGLESKIKLNDSMINIRKR